MGERVRVWQRGGEREKAYRVNEDKSCKVHQKEQNHNNCCIFIFGRNGGCGSFFLAGFSPEFFSF